MKNISTHTFGENVLAVVVAGIVLFVVGGKKIDGTLKLVKTEPTKQMNMLNGEQLMGLKDTPIIPVDKDQEKNDTPNPELVAILPKENEILQVKKIKAKKKQYPGVKQFA